MLTWLWTCNTGHNKLTTRKAYRRSSSIMIAESNVVFKPSISLSSFWFSWYPFCISNCNATFINNVKRVPNQCRLTSSELKKVSSQTTYWRLMLHETNESNAGSRFEFSSLEMLWHKDLSTNFMESMEFTECSILIMIFHNYYSIYLAQWYVLEPR